VPGPRRALITGAVVLVLVVVVAVAVLNGPDPGTVVLPLAALAGYLIGLPAQRLRMRRLLSAAQYRELSGDPAALALEIGLRRAGIRRVHLRAGARVRGLARNFRCGRTAVILVLESLTRRPDLAEFFLAHEAAHIARRDNLLRPLVMSALLGSWLAAAVSWPLACAALPLVVAAIAVYNRAMELDCDRIAARWAGAGAARASLQVLVTAREQTTASWTRRLRSMLTYPAPGRRIAAAAGARPADPPPGPPGPPGPSP
jgi:peptidase M48-like protein